MEYGENPIDTTIISILLSNIWSIVKFKPSLEDAKSKIGTDYLSYPLCVSDLSTTDKIT